MSPLASVHLSYLIEIGFVFKRTYYEKRSEFENRCRVATKLIMIEAFAIFNIYYLDQLRKRTKKTETSDTASASPAS